MHIYQWEVKGFNTLQDSALKGTAQQQLPLQVLNSCFVNYMGCQGKLEMQINSVNSRQPQSALSGCIRTSYWLS